jgi:hypothetical protein
VLYAYKDAGVLSLSLSLTQRERERERERERKRERGREGERECPELLFLFLIGMTGALAPFSNLVGYIVTVDNTQLHLFYCFGECHHA